MGQALRLVKEGAPPRPDLLMGNWAISAPWIVEALAKWQRMPSALGIISRNDIRPRHASRDGAIAIFPIVGIIMQRLDPIAAALFGATSTDQVARSLDAAIADPFVRAIVLEVDSPGGTIYGVDELATRIFQARTRKKIVAIANSQASSAAYWIASAAGELSVTPSGEVGSIGIVTVHTDRSQLESNAGIKTTLIGAGRYKTEGNVYEPLGAEARAALQTRADQYYAMFTGAVARGRGTSQIEVRQGFGQGRIVGAERAIKLRMADRIETLGQLMGRLYRN